MSLPALPLEIYSLIFNFATYVPEALDTSFEAINSNGHNASWTLSQIRSSNRTKASISNCSKLFHTLMGQSLYSTIVILEVLRIPPLLSILRSSATPNTAPRGHLCRRLDIHITTSSEFYDILDSELDEGGHTLFGLLPACPYLEVLITKVIYTDDRTITPPLDYVHPTHVALCKAISTFCARTLRRLELWGLTVRMDRLVHMLRYLTSLEVCSLSDIIPLKVRGMREDCWPRVWIREAGDYDLEVDTDAAWAYDWHHGAPELVRYKKRADEMDIFGDGILGEFLNSKRSLTWPPISDDACRGPCVLPKLHTLHAHCYNDNFFKMQLPVCRSLATSDGPYDPTIFNTCTRFKHYPNEENEVTDSIPQDGVYYTNPIPHSTAFGRFPSTITHLWVSFRYVMFGLSRVLYFFPNLIEFTWSDPCWIKDDTPFWPAFPSTCDSPRYPHTELRRITFVDTNSSHYEILHRINEEVLYAVEHGFLIGLEQVVVAYRASPLPDNSEYPFEELEQHNVKLSITAFET
ncbi:hypothetical protein H0H93_006312 [Arthromyces matolae]|nr:hypothetical protein H0H93_006312 [Arthromyces matolae]